MTRDSTTWMQSHRAFIERLTPWLLLIVMSVPLLTLRLAVYPPVWFDEGWSMNAARTLMEDGIYGTYTAAGHIPFDPGVTSGPTVIIPIALSFKLLGMGVVQARLIIVLFTLLGILGLHAIAAYVYGRTRALFVMMILLAMPAIHDVCLLSLGRQVLGETPSLALIALGFWLWFRSWDTERWSLCLLAGFALGLGLVSKMQVGFALLPALVLIAVGRVLGNRSQAVKLFAPTVVMLLVGSAWMLFGRLGTPSHIRHENAIMLLEAIRTHLLTGLFGRNLDTSAFAILIVIGTGVMASVWRLLGRLLGARRAANADWAEATVALFALCTALWFALLSVGWPRYAYVGLVMGQLLVGRLGWDVFALVRQWIGSRWPALGSLAYTGVIVGLALVAILMNVYPVLRFEHDYRAQQMADYIGTELPRDAVIESWSWELDALGPHREYHHPHSRYLFVAIRQMSHEQRPFDLDYDVLQADPDYLVRGPFDDWTRIYKSELVERDFAEMAEIGTYRLYERIR